MSGKLFALTKEPDSIKAEAVIAQIKEDEESLHLTAFTPEDAFTIGNEIRNKFMELQQMAPTLNGEEAHKECYGHCVYHPFPADKGIVVHIETFTGHTLFTATAGPPTSNPSNWRWVRGKINIAREMHCSSYRVGREWVHRGRDPADLGFNFPEYAAYGGAFPIWIRGVTVAPVAVVVVSGLSQDQDHQLVVDVLRAHIAGTAE